MEAKGGNFRQCVANPDQIIFRSFENPWTLHGFFMKHPSIWIKWMIFHSILANQDQIQCQFMENGVRCSGMCSLQRRDARLDGMVWRCKLNQGTSVRQNSFFASIKLPIPDVFQFIKNLLDGHTMRKCATFAAVCYKTTALTWVKQIRHLFKRYVYEKVIRRPMKIGFGGIVKVDESHFGKKHKFHTGKVMSKIDIWVVGLIERGSGLQILYPVDKLDSETLTKIIWRHFIPGSTIYSDGWSGYTKLND